jgi:hypothetical protein
LLNGLGAVQGQRGGKQEREKYSRRLHIASFNSRRGAQAGCPVAPDVGRFRVPKLLTIIAA